MRPVSTETPSTPEVITEITAEITAAIQAAVDERFEDLVDLTCELTRFASTRENEVEAQNFIASELSRRGYAVERVAIDAEALKTMPGFSPTTVSYDPASGAAENVIGIWNSETNAGRSLILNGHIDVVPEGPLDRWTTPPYQPHQEDGWLYGRGTGDMKAGIAAMIVALDALADLGFRPAAEVFLQSVIEEECTGNGALACLHAGYEAEAALIPEPFGEALMTAQVGVIWFQIRVEGVPTHVLETGSGSNAIEAMFPILAALKELEAEWNQPGNTSPHFVGVDHPLNLNIGKIQGGDWASSVPSWCEVDCRIGVFPGQQLDEAMAEIERRVAAVAAEHETLGERPPTVEFNGFLAEGYALEADGSAAAVDATEALAAAHLAVSGSGLAKEPTTATTDARFFGLYGGIPALVYGPRAERIHGFDERVELESARRVCQTIALFVARWCLLEPIR